MSLDDLPPQPALHTPAGRAYGNRVLERSRTVLLSRRNALLDLSYGASYWQKVDVFLPEKHTEPLPILLFAHGGSWIAGYKEWMAFMAPALTGLPAVFVSVSYRLAPAHKFPAPLHDCVDAIAWIHDHATSFGGNRSRIFVGGHSAGAHLMTLAALLPELLVARKLPENAVKGCLPVSAPYDLRPASQASSLEGSLYEPLLETWSDAPAASPIAHVHAGAPPFFITVGGADFPAFREQAEQMRDALTHAHVPTTYLDLSGHDHFDTNERSVEPGHPWLMEAARMLWNR